MTDPQPRQSRQGRLTAAAVSETSFDLVRNRYDREPVDGFKIEVAATLAELERELSEANARAQAAEERMQRLSVEGGGDPFKGALRLVEQQQEAQQVIDEHVAGCRRWAADFEADAHRQAAAVLNQAEATAATLLEDARRTAQMATGAQVVPEPKPTRDQVTDAVNEAEYVRAARAAQTDHHAQVMAGLDARMQGAFDMLAAARERLDAATVQLKGGPRP